MKFIKYKEIYVIYSNMWKYINDKNI